MSLLGLLRAADAGPVDLGALAASAPTAFVEMLAEAPHVETFVGRERELALMTSEEERPKVFVVRGVAGIGKSSFAAKACSALHLRWNLYWHGVRPWDTELSLLAGLGEVLAAMGRPGLSSVLVRGETARAVEILREAIAGTRSVLIYDDLHEADPGLVPFFRTLKDAVAAAPETRLIALTRRTVPFYDRRDVSLHPLVRELDLGGHPLFLQLLRSVPLAAIPGDVRLDIHRFVEETIYRELADAERRMMKVASLYGVPVPRDAGLRARLSVVPGHAARLSEVLARLRAPAHFPA